MYNKVLPVQVKLVFLKKSTTITGPKWSLNMRGWWVFSSSQLSGSHHHLVTTGASENTTGESLQYFKGTRKDVWSQDNYMYMYMHVAWSSKVLTLASIPTGLLTKLHCVLNLNTNRACIYMYMYLCDHSFDLSPLLCLGENCPSVLA